MLNGSEIRRNRLSFPLNYEEYSKEMEQNEEQARNLIKSLNMSLTLLMNLLPYEQELFTVDTVLAEKRERWHENLSSDIYMEEAVNVLEDMKMNNIKNRG